MGTNTRQDSSHKVSYHALLEKEKERERERERERNVMYIYATAIHIPALTLFESSNSV